MADTLYRQLSARGRVLLSVAIVVLFAVAFGIGSTAISHADDSKITINGLPGAFVRWGYAVPGNSRDFASVQNNIRNLDILAPFYFILHRDGSITGSDNATMTSLALTNGVKIVPMIKNSDAELDDFHALMSDQPKRAAIIAQINSLIGRYRYDGIHIDWENVNADDRDVQTQFMRELRQVLRPQNKLVTQALVGKTYDATTGWSGSYDYRALGALNDYVVLMCYDYSWSGTKNGGPVAPATWTQSVLNFARARIPAGQIILGVPFYGRAWNVTTNDSKDSVALTTNDVTNLANQYPNGLITGYDTTYEENWMRYSHDNQNFVAWYQTPRSFSAKIDLLRRNGIGGFAAWRMGYESSDFWRVMRAVVVPPTLPVVPFPNDTNRLFFGQTGHSLRADFKQYWETHGGLAQFGYPTTEPFEEVNPDDGRIYTVQYFERNRFELHPESLNPNYRVLLGLLSKSIAQDKLASGAISSKPFQPIPAFQSSANRWYMVETGHSLSNGFLAYWNAHGGLAINGFPISEEFSETTPEGTYLVQYFERARYEYHPEAPQQYRVLLGLLGNQVLRDRGWIN